MGDSKYKGKGFSERRRGGGEDGSLAINGGKSRLVLEGKALELFLDGPAELRTRIEGVDRLAREVSIELAEVGLVLHVGDERRLDLPLL